MDENVSVEQLRHIIETIPDGIIIINRDGRVVFVNTAAEKILGLSRSDIIGRRYGEEMWKATTLEGEPFPDEQYPFPRVMREGKPVYDVEYVIERPGGERATISVNAAPLGYEDGRPAGMIASFTDITKRVEAEKELKESERRFHEILEKAHLVTTTVDIEGNVTFVNDFLLSLTGWSREDLLGKKFDRFIPPDKREEVRAAFNRAVIAGDLMYRYETDVITKWGQRRTLAFTNVFLRDPQGKVTGTVNIGEDITEHKRAAEEIRESRQQVLDILESITDGFFALDNLWRFTYVNHRAQELLDVRKEQLLFRSIWNVLPQAQKSTFQQEFLRAKDEGVPTSFEGYYPPLERWFEVHAYPYENGISVYFSDITDRKQTEQALKESEEKFRAVVEQSMHGIFIGTPEGTGMLYNKAMERMFGYTIEEVNKYGWFNLVIPDEELRSRVIATATRAIAGEVSYVEFPAVRRNGEHVWASLSGTPVTIGGKRYVAGIATDITDRKEAQERLQESEHKYRSLLENASDAIFVTDAQGNFLEVNKKAEELTGYAKEELLHMSFFQLHPKEELGRIAEAFERAFKTGEAGSVRDIEIVRKDGGTVPIDLTGSVVEYKGKRVAQAIIRDVRGQKEIEHVLRRSEQQCRRLIELSPDGLIISRDGIILYINKIGLELCGTARRNQLTGRPLSDIFHSDLLRIINEQRDRLKAGKKTGLAEGKLMRADGSVIYVELSSAVITYEGGPATITHLRDITQRKKAS